MKKVNFGRIAPITEPPLLLEMQSESFAEFLQQDVPSEKRKPHGLQGAFRDVFPLTNSDGSLTMEFVSYTLGDPKYSVGESIARDANYSAPLKVLLRLIQKQENGKEKELAEQEVYFGDIPLMTKTATFIINGAERVVVSQIHRSPGVIFEDGKDIKDDFIPKLKEKKIKSFVIHRDPSMLLTLKKDPVKTKKEAISLIYKILKTQEFIIQERAAGFLDELLFKSTRRYDLSLVGRYKIFKKLGPVMTDLMKEKKFDFNMPSDHKRTLTKEDVVATLRYLLKLYNGASEYKSGDKSIKIQVDDIDHLGNRRVRSVGELLENQVRIGLVQMARLVREHMNMQDKTTVTPRGLINITPFVSQIRKFFGTSQLSQFMDQTNPLAELTHKRRLSALGPGGLNRKRAGFEVRDVHYTHYGRICPIETPEGPNIGLITSLATYARVNEYGLIETPYIKVEKGRVTDKIENITADIEDEHIIAPGNVEIDKNGYLPEGFIIARQKGAYPLVKRDKIDYIDISPKQMVSASAGLIPFIEHDDANRALMGSNMQRQALPLLITEPPIVSTGMESVVARNSGSLVAATRGGEVIYVDGGTVIIWNDEEGKEIETDKLDIYRLKKYQRSNQDTNYSQTPIVSKGDSVKKGDIIADGPATANGELALGKNVFVAFMSWEGYNFEDAVLMSDRLVRDD